MEARGPLPFRVIRAEHTFGGCPRWVHYSECHVLPWDLLPPPFSLVLHVLGPKYPGMCPCPSLSPQATQGPAPHLALPGASNLAARLHAHPLVLLQPERRPKAAALTASPPPAAWTSAGLPLALGTKPGAFPSVTRKTGNKTESRLEGVTRQSKPLGDGGGLLASGGPAP